MRRTVTSLAVALSTMAVLAGQAQPPAGQAPPQGEGRQGGGGGRGRGGVPPVPYDDYTGFTKLWDGATFANWDGETDVWSIDNGAIHADTTRTPGQHHIHYIGPGAVMRDFDLKVEMKMSATGANGGIQYRSRLLHAAHGGSIAGSPREEPAWQESRRWRKLSRQASPRSPLRAAGARGTVAEVAREIAAAAAARTRRRVKRSQPLQLGRARHRLEAVAPDAVIRDAAQAVQAQAADAPASRPTRGIPGRSAATSST